MENYFNYFTEIEERYQRRRGSALLLSTLDWALIETWKSAGIPLEAVLRGIDTTFDKYDAKPARAKTRKINSLAFCSQEVLASAEEMKEAAVGAGSPASSQPQSGLSRAEVAAYLAKNSAALMNADAPEAGKPVLVGAARALEELARTAASGSLEAIERHLTVLEEKIFAALLAATPDNVLLEVRTEADRDIAPYRSKMSAAQIEQLHRQYVHKRLLERARLPRLSLFYM